LELPGLVNIQKTMKHHRFSWVNQLFRSHFPVRKLSAITRRVYPISIPLNHYKIPLNHYKSLCQPLPEAKECLSPLQNQLAGGTAMNWSQVSIVMVPHTSSRMMCHVFWDQVLSMMGSHPKSIAFSHHFPKIATGDPIFSRNICWLSHCIFSVVIADL
jgi:hypothetical protein